MISKRNIPFPVECFYCGIEIHNKWEHTYDHVIALSNGGKNDWSNIVECCKKCNSEKDNKTIEEWSAVVEQKLIQFQQQSPNHPAIKKYKILDRNLKEIL